MTLRTKGEQKAYLDGYEMCANCIKKYLTDEDKQKLECLLAAVRTAVDIEDETAIKTLEQQPSEDAEVVKISKGAVKARQGRFVIYDVEWLKRNFYVTEEKIYGQPKEPCEDCISRKAELDGLASIAKTEAKSDAQKALMGRVMYFTEQLPPVAPKYTDEEIDRAQVAEQAYIDKMVELAVEETKRPEGKWIEIFVETPNDPYSYGFKSHKCSKCEYRPLQISNYCPNCGAKMLQEEEPDY